MKKSILGLALAVAMATSISATSVDVITNFGGNTEPAGRFYVPVTSDMSLLLGYTGNFYTKNTASDSKLALGASQALPYVGLIEVYGDFNLDAGANGNMLTDVVVAKNWMFKLTDKVKVGIRIPLLTVETAGNYKVSIMSSVIPQVGATLDF